MNRAALAAWAAGLEPTRYAAALAALGVVGAASDGQAATARGAEAAIERAWSAPLMRWRLPPPPYDDHDAGALAATWLMHRAAWRETRPRLRHGDPELFALPLPRLAVELPAEDDPAWIVGRLSLDAVGPLSVHVADTPRTGRLAWRWPLEIGLLDDAQSVELERRLIARGDLSTRFARPRIVAGGGGSCDLLLVTEPLRAAAGPLLGSGVRASCVLVLRPPTARWSVTGPLLAALRAHVGAAGIGFAPVPPARVGDWVDALLVALAHDNPLDVAVRMASMQTGAADPLLIADKKLLDETRLSRVAERLHARAGWGVAGARAVMREAGPAAGAELTFDRETHGASELVRMGRALREDVDEPDPARYIQAQLMTAAHEPLAAPLTPGADHVLAVRVGPPEVGWTSAAGESFPRLEGAESYRLTVVLSAPGVLPEPLTDEIVLPAHGASTACEFAVRPPAGCTRLQARIVVLHGNRVLQTATVDAPVGGAANGELRLSAEPETVVRLRLDDLDSRRPFDAALVVNHDESGTPGVTAISGQRARLLMAHEFQGAVDRVHEILEDAVLLADGFDSLEDDASVRLLVKLANHGNALHETFMDSEGAQSVVDAERLQLVAVRDGADFPLEFVYDRAAPEPGAGLCPGAAAGLRAGHCGPDCPPPTDTSVVCPLGFWGLTKSIERAPFRGAIENYEIEVRAEPSHEVSHLSAPRSALYAASEVVADGDVEGLRDALAGATGGHANRATSWAEWKQSVAADHPAVLVIVPHTLPHPDLEIDAMEISADALARTNIHVEHVCPNREHRPIVVLLGCNTAASQIPIHAFPPKFQREGAAIVLGTVTKVLGRHAAPVAGRIVTELVARAGEGEAYMTEVVRDVRRALLAEGLPFGLTLVAYGDGEWLLGGGDG
jgi:hypothetical protein